MKSKELKAEILTALRKYDDLGLVDYITLDNLIKNELVKFGSNVMEPRAKVIEITGGQADLPIGFFKLNLAVKCQPYSVEPIFEKDQLWRQDYGMSKRIVENYEWDNMSNSHYKKSYKEITEFKEIRGSKIHIKHQPTEVLCLAKKFPKEYVTESSVNRMVNHINGVSDINITSSKIYTNFREGFIYMEYDSLPEEDGELVVPNIPHLEDYLRHFCIYSSLASIWTNDEMTGLESKVSFYKQESDRLKANALTASKFDNLSSDWHKKIQLKNKRNIRRNYR